ncbi:MAG TPA: tyrosine-type recombinase/integrase [Caulobacteraceae bacterium]
MQDLVDGVEPGLRLRVSARSARWHVTVGGNDCVQAKATLGSWPQVSIADARLAARSIIHNLSRLGPPERNEGALGAILDRYESRRLAQLRKGVVMSRAIRAALDGLLLREMSSITRADIGRIVDDIADRAPIQGNRSLAYLKAFFAWAHGRGYIEANPIQALAKPTREIARDRTPNLGEIAEIWSACGALSYPFGHVIRLMVLTAVRRDEAAAMRVSELQLPAGEAEGCWVLPAERSKNGRSLRVPLSASARAIVEAALAARPEESPFVFSTTGLRAVSGWSKAKSRLDSVIAKGRHGRAVEPMTAWRLHDLRRSFATAACDALDVDPAVADRCLNHVGASTTSTISRVYGRSEMYQQRADALRRWAELVTVNVSGASLPQASPR